MSKQTVHFFCLEPELVRCFRTRICLHGHELYSQECLSFLPRYPHQVAGISHSSSSDTRSQMGPSHVRSCPPIPGPDHWTESCFYRGEDGIARPLSLLWTGCVPGMPDGGPRMLQAIATTGVSHTLRFFGASGEEYLP